MKKQAAVVTLMSVLASANTNAGNAQGLIRVVNVNKDWNGFMVQLDNSLSANYEAQCPFANWAYMSVDDPFYASMLASLLAAKISGETVTVYTNGCTTSPHGQVPRISTVDVGLRSGP